MDKQSCTRNCTRNCNQSCKNCTHNQKTNYVYAGFNGAVKDYVSCAKYGNIWEKTVCEGHVPKQ